MKDTWPLFPEVWHSLARVQEIKNGRIDVVLQLRSKFRQKHTDGKWYLSRILKTYYLEDHPKDPIKQSEEILKYTKQFQREMYNVIMFSKVVPEMKHVGNTSPVYVLDKDQRDEKERLFQHLK